MFKNMEIKLILLKLGGKIMPKIKKEETFDEDEDEDFEEELDEEEF
jgi:hypothetical protein